MKRLLAASAVLCACASLGTPACNDDPESHVYVASLYNAALNCFGASTPLGTIETGSGALDCKPTCLVLSSAGSESIYVSTMCGPFPVQFDSTQNDPSCVPALLAWTAQATALANGTNSCASPAEDGGEDASAVSEDGGSDAGASVDGGEDAIGPDASDGGVSMDASGE